MIASLAGILAVKSSDYLVVDVGGVGYKVYASVSTLGALPDEGSPVRLRIRTVVREDAIDLFGFATAEEQELFEELTKVSKIGPKTARQILGGASVDDIARFIVEENVVALTKIPGIGRKTAEQIIVALRDKMKAGTLARRAVPTGGKTTAADGKLVDLMTIMLNFGFKRGEIDRAVRTLGAERVAAATIEELVKDLLKSLSKAV